MLSEFSHPNALHGKTIFVTGASRGIGRQAAIAFASCGAEVILCARDIRALEGTYDQIVANGSPEPAIFPLDLATAGPDQYELLFDAIQKEFGKLDGLLHNASMLGELTPIEHHKPAKWQEVIQVNLNAPYILTQTCLPLLKQAHKASIVFTTSHFPLRAKAYWGAYAVAKSGIITLMQLLVEELDNTSISINAINPGPIRSPLRCKAYPAEDKSPLLTPADIMPIYIKLINASRYQLNGKVVDAQAELKKIKAFNKYEAETAMA